MKFHTEVLLNIFMLASSCWLITKSDRFKELVDLEPLVNTEGKVVDTLEKYIQLEEKRLEKVRRFRDEYERLHKAAISDVDTFLSNPVNAFLLVKRLKTDWNIVEDLVKDSTSKAVIDNITQKELFPDEEDLSGASTALLRLQDTYALNTTKIAGGDIAGMAASSNLTAEDCFELGRQAFLSRNFYYTVLWMQEMFNQIEEGEMKKSYKVSAFEHMAFSYFMLGKVNQAIKLTKDTLRLDPNCDSARGNLEYYEEYLFTKGKVDVDDKVDDSILERPYFINLVDYERLCRGEPLKTPAEESQLYCRYTTNNSSYLLLQPAKEEVLHLDPMIIVYHDVMRDKDINILKELAQPKLSRATVLNPDTGELNYATYRVSKSCWLDDEFHPRVTQASRMVEEITGLETDTAEFLQINKYGIGGHYEPHYDFRRPGEVDGFAKFGTGNRIATWLYYLSDVDAGGATVFPELRVHVKPIKGSAGFWYNLFRSGEGDLRTKHAACPVLAGSKWVANKWIHEKEQEFRRPCSLKPSE